MATSFADIGIQVPRGIRGEWRSTCPRCSHARKKKRDRCLSVNVDTGLWHCHNCGYAGQLGGYASDKRQDAPSPAPTRAAEIRRIWEESSQPRMPGPAMLYLRRRGFYGRFES